MSKKVDFGIKSQLITKEELARRVKELGEQITKDFKDDIVILWDSSNRITMTHPYLRAFLKACEKWVVKVDTL